ncbi:hypothetical protein [Nonlabens sp. Asnod3-A02]|uniref:hypothetical protein n=1 Tax=Nonlabens sp. Asnod3-A02 TaxID=3160579 RepID=UPI00386637D1
MALGLSTSVKIVFAAFILLLILSCENQPQEIKIALNDISLSGNTIAVGIDNEPARSSQIIPIQDKIYKYVDAPSGLNFRDAPKGKLLGKFPDNYRLEILEMTDVSSIVKDGNKEISGTWVKVTTGRVIGYVFDGFLSNNYKEIAYENNINDLSILTMDSYEKKNDETIPFISLTDGYWSNRFPKVLEEYQNESSINNDEKQNEIYYHIKGEERITFLNNRELDESDFLFIYNYQTDQLKQFKVKDVPLFTHESIYGGGDYLTGFNLEGLIETNNYSYYNSFAHVGKENPFLTNSLSSINWKAINTSKVPKIELAYGEFFKSTQYDIKVAYHYVIDNNDYYYTRNSFDNGTYTADYIFALSPSKQVLYMTEVTDSESHSPSLYLEENMELPKEPNHYAGRLFKDKPPVIFGLYYTSFGCPFIAFLDDKERIIYIQCDNRH